MNKDNHPAALDALIDSCENVQELGDKVGRGEISESSLEFIVATAVRNMPLDDFSPEEVGASVIYSLRPHLRTPLSDADFKKHASEKANQDEARCLVGYDDNILWQYQDGSRYLLTADDVEFINMVLKRDKEIAELRKSVSKESHSKAVMACLNAIRAEHNEKSITTQTGFSYNEWHYGLKILEAILAAMEINYVN